jgi:hypothetical protein
MTPCSLGSLHITWKTKQLQMVNNLNMTNTKKKCLLNIAPPHLKGQSCKYKEITTNNSTEATQIPPSSNFICMSVQPANVFGHQILPK